MGSAEHHAVNVAPMVRLLRHGCVSHTHFSNETRGKQTQKVIGKAEIYASHQFYIYSFISSCGYAELYPRGIISPWILYLFVYLLANK